LQALQPQMPTATRFTANCRACSRYRCSTGLRPQKCEAQGCGWGAEARQ
jgi:hypothetical protein